jgi:hypothetical protein
MLALHNNRRALFTRWVSLFLVVFILYGTTVEAAHRHGRVLLSKSSATSQVDNEQTTHSSANKTGCSDCLICQLHLNFSAAAIALRLKHDVPTQAPQRVATIVIEDLLSQIISPFAGRAPPQAN